MDHAKPRVLFLVTTSEWGGVQNFIFNLAQEMAHRGFEILIAAGGDGELGPRCAEVRLPYLKLKTMRREISLFRDLAALHEIRGVIKQFKPTAVHLNSSKMGVIGAWAANLEKVPRVVYRIGGWAFLEQTGWLKHKIYLWSEILTAAKKDIIVTVHPADEALAKLHHIQPRHQIMTIANGLDLEKFDRVLLSREAARAELGLTAEPTVIGTVANFFAPKNIPWYLKTLAQLSDLPDTVKFVIVGDGPDRPLIEKLQQDLNLTRRVILTGRKINTQSLYRAFDFFVLPSSKEGMPWALLEAMAASLPCITTDVGACRWMLEPDAGVVVPNQNQTALAQAIRSLLADKTRSEQLEKAARLAVANRFQWQTAVEKTINLLTN